ncbi:uncharacterized protein si:ch211-139g16.8 isoform X1 [Triplophysa rosa]|uniref:Ig-like domain-containing protein n=1 Tax=Triplophysa rosa TaxID=992332 RepID=A0A9W7WKT9_TRIRA|nr:uncharacterized protein si:ch211-139g16.8 isoform X1 [Triplophysa rosa]KAI7803599.1 hypothetical protein IRJ41_008882 [Triplophysa rosa]
MSLFSITCLVFISVFSVCGCKIDVHQSTRMMQRKVQQSVSVPCSCNISSCPGDGLDNLKISWYVFRKDMHYQIDLNNQPTKYTLEGHSLKISSLSIKDCGVYYCAAALSNEMHSGAQAIGQGITLKVTERGLNVRQILLLTLLVLLIIYSLLVLGIIICIKTGHIKSLCRGRWRKTQDYSRHVVFSGVVQELYKRNLVHDKIPARCKVSQEKAKSPQTQDKNEDIYQNFEE